MTVSELKEIIANLPEEYDDFDVDLLNSSLFLFHILRLQ